MRVATQDTLTQALSIAGEYDGNLTLRQLYYQLVARGYIPNSQASYSRLGVILADARLAGTFPFEWLMDRTRESRPGSFIVDQTDVHRMLTQAADEVRTAPRRWIWRDRWLGQPTHVSVWVEKEALAGVFEEPCSTLGVAWFVLRGYSSLSALSQWVDHTNRAFEDGRGIERAVVLYFGDHDPDGWEIPRSAERNVRAIADVRGVELPPVTFKRVALNRAQIELYDPPPFPAKETSSRYAGYVREHGLTSAWELDALRPEVLQELIRSNVDALFDTEIHDANNDDVRRARDDMRQRMLTRGWIDQALST
jgi:hypothetical protein